MKFKKLMKDGIVSALVVGMAFGGFPLSVHAEEEGAVQQEQVEQEQEEVEQEEEKQEQEEVKQEQEEVEVPDTTEEEFNQEEPVEEPTEEESTEENSEETKEKESEQEEDTQDKDTEEKDMEKEEDSESEEETDNEKAEGILVKFIGFDDEILAEVRVEDVSEIEYPEAPAVEGYTFKEWEMSDTEADDLEEIEVRAIYEENKTELIKVVFIGFEDKELDVQEVESLADIQEPEVPMIEGYVFKSWDTDLKELAEKEISEDMLEKGITIKAVYTEIEKDKLSYQEISTTLGDKEITIKGNLPEGAEVSASKQTITSDIEKSVTDAFGADNTEKEVKITVYEVFDIYVVYDGQKYSPEAFGKDTQVSIKGLDIKKSEESKKIGDREIKSTEELKLFKVNEGGATEVSGASVNETEATFNVNGEMSEEIKEMFNEKAETSSDSEEDKGDREQPETEPIQIEGDKREEV